MDLDIHIKALSMAIILGTGIGSLGATRSHIYAYIKKLDIEKKHRWRLDGWVEMIHIFLIMFGIAVPAAMFIGIYIGGNDFSDWLNISMTFFTFLLIILLNKYFNKVDEKKKRLLRG